MTNFKAQWLQGELERDDAINVKRIYIDINDGNLTDGIMFSQIMYWHSHDKNGRSRLRVNKYGHYWLAKNYGDWWSECRVNKHTARKSIDRMTKSGLLIKKLYKFNGTPTLHLRIDWKEFEQRIKSIWYNRSSGFDTTGQIEMSSEVNSLTETTTENLSENLTYDTHVSANAENRSAISIYLSITGIKAIENVRNTAVIDWIKEQQQWLNCPYHKEAYIKAVREANKKSTGKKKYIFNADWMDQKFLEYRVDVKNARYDTETGEIEWIELTNGEKKPPEQFPKWIVDTAQRHIAQIIEQQAEVPY